MNTLLQRVRTFSFHLGLVEQAQIVASTAVVVMMVTIISANIVLKETIGFFELISIITVGVIGFAGVYFSLKYGRQMEGQNAELVALNTIAHAVNRTMNLPSVFETVLKTITTLLKNEYGWLYILEKDTLTLKHSSGTRLSFFSNASLSLMRSWDWMQVIHRRGETLPHDMPIINTELNTLHFASWVCVPLEYGAGVIILASRSSSFFSPNRINLVSAFGNQINVALTNEQLFSQLRQSQEQYADLFEHSPDMYHLIDRNGTILGCNYTEATTLGYDKEDIVGKHLSCLYPEDQHDRLVEFILTTFDEKREVRDQEHQILHKDGSVLDVSVNASLVFNDKGMPVLLRCVMRDITKKKKFEEKIIQAQKIDSIGNLAGGVAHDFNNILTSIGNAAAIMQRRIGDHTALAPFIEIISTAAQRGSKLTAQLLTFARRTPTQLHPVDLHHILDETLALFEPGIPSGITITRHLTPAQVLINGDEGHVQQSLLNILLNARDAMPDGGTITVTSAVNAYDPTVTLTICDTGMGMPPSIQQHIFEPFFSTKDIDKGTGLGLSVVYGVMNAHGGSIAVESTPANGASFALTFPLLDNGTIELPLHQSPVTKGNGEAILIVDDEPTIGFTLATLLNDWGYTAQSVQSGKAALEVIAVRHFDLLILDMNMPDMNGEKLVRRIKRKNYSGKIIISSGYKQTRTDATGLPSTVDGFLSKPYLEHELTEQVRAILTR